MANPIVKLNGRTIGTIFGRKLIKSGKQVVLMQTMDGFGMPKVLIDLLVEREVKSAGSVPDRNTYDRVPVAGKGSTLYDFDLVEIHYENTIYQASVRTFKERGVLYHKPPFEAQYILPRRHFTTVIDKQEKLF